MKTCNATACGRITQGHYYWFCLTTLACFAMTTFAQTASLRSTLVEIEIADNKELRTVFSQGFDVCDLWQLRANQVQILVNAQEMAALESLGFELKVINTHMRARHRAKAKGQAPDRHSRLHSVMGEPDPNIIPEEWRFHTYDQIISDLHALEASGITHVSTIGFSVEGREIWAIKISDNPIEDEDEPDALVVGGVHAREWITHEMTYHLAMHLVENYPHDPVVQYIVDNSEVWIVPVVNPDGRIYTETQDRFWRKNRRDNGDGTFGVDLNRNFALNWGGEGASLDPASELYAGPAPFSEPESRAIRDLMQMHAFDVYLDYHSPVQLILYPWGHTDTPAPDTLLHHKIANRMAELIRDVNDTDYPIGPGSSLYTTSGNLGDWVYGELDTTSIVVELGGGGFDLPEENVREVVEDNLPAALYFLTWGAGFGHVQNPNTGQTYRQILPAIADAIDGDEIFVDPGTYLENLVIEDKQVVLSSIEPQDPCVVAATVIQGYGRDAVVTLSGRHNSPTDLVGLTLTEGTVDVFNKGAAPTLHQCSIHGSNNVAVQYRQGLEPELIDCTITGDINKVYHPAIIAHWALDETAGNTTLDLFSRQQAEVFGDPAWQSAGGVVDGALLMDGINDYIQTPHVINPEDPFSIFLWIKGGSPGQTILSQDSMSDWLLLDAGTGTLTTKIKPAGRGLGQTLTSSAAVTEDDWHQVGLVWDGMERRIYLDADIVAREIRSAGLKESLHGLNIGCGMNQEDGTFWFGLFDDVRVYWDAIEP